MGEKSKPTNFYQRKAALLHSLTTAPPDILEDSRVPIVDRSRLASEEGNLFTFEAVKNSVNSLLLEAWYGEKPRIKTGISKQLGVKYDTYTYEVVKDASDDVLEEGTVIARKTTYTRGFSLKKALFAPSVTYGIYGFGWPDPDDESHAIAIGLEVTEYTNEHEDKVYVYKVLEGRDFRQDMQAEDFQAFDVRYALKEFSHSFVSMDAPSWSRQQQQRYAKSLGITTTDPYDPGPAEDPWPY
jgi:hypothetical protein